MEITNIFAYLFSLFVTAKLAFAGDVRQDTIHVKPGAGTLSVEHELETRQHAANWKVAISRLIVVIVGNPRIRPVLKLKKDWNSLMNGYKCKFTYAAQGGTHEEWEFSLELIEGGSAVMCTVAREKQSSYLYFENFKMEVTGPFVTISEVDIKASQRENKNLQSAEFSQEKNVVSSTAQFKNRLEKVAVYCSLPRVDL